VAAKWRSRPHTSPLLLRFLRGRSLQVGNFWQFFSLDLQPNCRIRARRSQDDLDSWILALALAHQAEAVLIWLLGCATSIQAHKHKFWCVGRLGDVLSAKPRAKCPKAGSREFHAMAYGPFCWLFGCLAVSGRSKTGQVRQLRFQKDCGEGPQTSRQTRRQTINS
jgi:hypothetical protein